MFAVLSSGIVVGALLPLYLDLRGARKTMADKVAEFDEITRKAADANNSMANKLLQIEERVNNVEFWNSQAQSAPNSGWKGR
jgi:hypothetical protein